ncbi:UNVERIFIED_CONTAM: hypothetical protein GTU68_032510 [Idotea baltica]|nr:hypothetical protein [Idotea baltica]
MLNAISPIDGRYHQKTASLTPYFSEGALIKYRVVVEINYLCALSDIKLPQLEDLTDNHKSELIKWASRLSESGARSIKEIERTTNHDVKAVEYYIKDKLEQMGLSHLVEFVHFGLTSQDINNTAFPMMIKDSIKQVYIPLLAELMEALTEKATRYSKTPILSHTHGQPASPSTMGKEFKVFIERLQDQMILLNALPIKAKFGGATGNFNAHLVAYPDVDWVGFSNDFISSLGLVRSQHTTQIAHYDHLAAVFHAMARLHTILIDLCRDIWTYISMNYFTQKSLKNEVGSSTMPHKINPIDFENAEGNLGLANAVLYHLAEKLPISRLQRDLTDSTVLRNIGVPMGHGIIAFQSILKGLQKIDINEDKIRYDLDQNWAIISEAIQTILRREGYPKPYEALKALTRGSDKITAQSISAFIDELNISSEIKSELRAITPWNYTGNAAM